MNTELNSQNVFNNFYTQKQNFENKTKEKENRKAKIIAAASFAGAVIPLVLYNAKRGKFKEIKDVFQSQTSSIKDKIGAATGILEVDGIKGIFTSVTGSIIGGLLAGCSGEKSHDNKKAKYKEGLYGFLNCMVPMSIISLAETFVEKKNIKTGVLGKAAMVAIGVGGGTLITNKFANALNKRVFKEEKKEEFKKRKIKPTDFLVHMDDVLAVMVMAKVPFANHLGKALPFIFTHVGYEAGTSKK